MNKYILVKQDDLAKSGLAYEIVKSLPHKIVTARSLVNGVIKYLKGKHESHHPIETLQDPPGYRNIIISDEKISFGRKVK